MQTKHKSFYQTTIKAPVDKLWDALTNPQIVKQYSFGSDIVTDWKVGNPIIFQGEYEGKPGAAPMKYTQINNQQLKPA